MKTISNHLQPIPKKNVDSWVHWLRFVTFCGMLGQVCDDSQAFRDPTAKMMDRDIPRQSVSLLA